jgi:hypothetical protein
VFAATSYLAPMYDVDQLFRHRLPRLGLQKSAFGVDLKFLKYIIPTTQDTKSLYFSSSFMFSPSFLLVALTHRCSGASLDQARSTWIPRVQTEL